MSNDLYTSQVHLKRLLAGQATAAFTPVPVDVAKLIDPAFVPGMGALNEDEKGRLQCPIRGCGEFHYYLGNHAHRSHKGIGGMNAIRQAIGIPKRVSLLSRRARVERRAFTARAIAKAQATPGAASGRISVGDGRGGRHAGEQYADSQISMHQRNHADSCPGQLQARITSLRDKLGHSPTGSEFKDAYGYGMLKAVYAVFGTWNNAKATCGLVVYENGFNPPHTRTRRLDVALVAESLRAFVEANGDLPNVNAGRDGIAPRIPAPRVIMRVFGVDNWQAAMRSAVEYLGIDSERYGKCSHRRGVA